jgi:hypothetical protein
MVRYRKRSINREKDPDKFLIQRYMTPIFDINIPGEKKDKKKRMYQENNYE